MVIEGHPGFAGGRTRAGGLLLAVLSIMMLSAPGAAIALSPAVEFSLRDGAPPDGTADDLIVPPDSNYGRIFSSSLFDAEMYVEFSLAGAVVAPEVQLSLGINASDMDLVYGESKTFDVSTYAGAGAASLAAFGQGSLLETVVLPSNGAFALDLDLTDAWNDAVTAGDDYLGIRIHDPVWTGTLVGAGTLIYGSANVNVVPEPATASLVGLGLAALGVRARRRTKDVAPPRGQRGL